MAPADPAGDDLHQRSRREGVVAARSIPMTNPGWTLQGKVRHDG
ncbi:hypothetical protein [Pannonibacter tanglangensis]|nr:hypothetical protein [Pannonibacter sp. XCT-34]